MGDEAMISEDSEQESSRRGQRSVDRGMGSSSGRGVWKRACTSFGDPSILMPGLRVRTRDSATVISVNLSSRSVRL